MASTSTSGRGASGGTILIVLSFLNMWNYIDRMIVSGSPLQFSAFVSCTLQLSETHTALALGCITPAFMVTFSVASIGIGHIVNVVPPFRVLSIGMSAWCVAVAGSGLAYWMPAGPGTYWWFVTMRALSGVGEAAFQCIVPAYVEEFAPEGSRAMWLATLYMSIPTGSAIGFGYGALFATSGGPLAAKSPPHSLGWGWAYLLEAAIVLPCAIALAWLPSASAIRSRRAAAAAAATTMHAPLLPAGSNGGGAAAAATSSEAWPTRSSGSLPPAEPTAAAASPPVSCDSSSSLSVRVPSDGAATTTTHAGADGPADGPTREAPTPKESPGMLGKQLAYLLGSGTYVLIALGYAAFTFTVMGISQFAPLILLALGFFNTEFAASIIFGAVSAFAGVIGTPIGGYLTDLATRRAHAAATSALSSAAAMSAATAGGHVPPRSPFRNPRESGPLPFVEPPWTATLREARALTGAITLMIGLSAVLCVIASAILYLGPDFKWLFLAVLCACVTLSFGTSAGISRATMLVVPPFMRPLALGMLSLLLHALGDVPSPLIFGAMIGAWAPACSHVVYANATANATCALQQGAAHIDDACAANAPPGGLYGPQQDGVVAAMLLGSIYMLTACVYWGCAWVVLGGRMKRERVCPPVG